MSENEVTDKTLVGVIEAVEAVIATETEPEAQADPAPVAEPEVESEPGAKIVVWYSDEFDSTCYAEKQIAELEAKGWTFRGMTCVGYEGVCTTVLYVRPQAAVRS